MEIPEHGRDLADFAIDFAQQLGATYAEARYEVIIANEFILKNGNPEIGVFDRSLGIGVRVLANGGMGFASTNELTQSSIKETVKFAVDIAKSSAKFREKPIQFSEEKVHEASFEAPYKQLALDVDLDTKMDYIIEIDSLIQKSGAPYRVVFFSDSDVHKYVVTSDGARIAAHVPRIGMFYLLTAVGSNGRMEQGFWQHGGTGGWELLDDWNLVEKIPTLTAKLKKIAEEAQKPPKGTIDYVLGSNVVGLVCHENMGHPSESDRILGREGAQAGESYLTPDMLGTKIGSDVVTIIDDPTLDKSYGWYLYDDEGVKARPRYLMKNGVFEEMLHNRESAFYLGLKSNAGARSSRFDREPIIRMANTYMAPGDYTEEEIFEDIKLGIYMLDHSEWNIDDRRFQSKYVGRTAFLIKDGELTDILVYRPVLETTTPGLLSSIDAVSKTLQFDAATCGKGEPMQGAPVWHGGPTAVRVRNVKTAH